MYWHAIKIREFRRFHANAQHMRVFSERVRRGFDMNSDGLEDLAVAAPGDAPAGEGEGQVHILLMPEGR